MVEQPEQVVGVFEAGLGAAGGMDRLPEAGEFGGLVVANPLDDLGGTQGECYVARQGMRPGGAGEELAGTFENRQMLGFEGAANGGNQDGGVAFGVGAGMAEGGKQRGRNALAADTGGDRDLAHFGVGFVKTPGRHRVLRGRLVVHPGVVTFTDDPPALFGFHGFQPRRDGLLGALGADFGGEHLEGQMAKTLAVEAAEIGLIGVVVGRAEPNARKATAGHRLIAAGGRIDLDRLFFEHLLGQVRLPQMADGFFLGEKQRAIELAMKERRAGGGHFKQRPAPAALGEQNFRNIKERVNAGDLADFLADQMDCLAIGMQSHPHAGRRENLLRWGRGVAAVLKRSPPTLALALALALAGPAVIAATRIPGTGVAAIAIPRLS